MNEPYVSNQICVLKTDKKLIAFYDKLRVASTYNYAQLHADGEYLENGRKVHSLIGLTLLDYTNGKGSNTISVKVNLSPDEAEYVLSRLYAGFPVFELHHEKIFGPKDQNGYATAAKLSITRNTQNYKGEPLRIPWKISAANGKGIPVINPAGGTFMQKGSFQAASKAAINLTDEELFALLNRVVHYVHMWEATVAPTLITNGKRALQAARERKQAQQQGQSQPAA